MIDGLRPVLDEIGQQKGFVIHISAWRRSVGKPLDPD
jgi:hypothetical protein